MSQTSGGQQTTSDSTTPALSSDGSIVAFATTGSLDGNGIQDTNGLIDVYRHNVATGVTDVVSTIAGGSTAAGNSGMKSLDISDDGSKVFFLSDAQTLLASPPPLGSRNVYVRDFATNSTAMVNIDNAGNPISLRGSGYFSASADGTKVAFLGNASPLSGTQGMYIRDLSTNTTSFAYYADDGEISLSGDGTHLAFTRTSTTTPGGGCPSGIVTELYIWHFDAATGTSIAVLANAGTSSNFCDFAGVLGPNALSANGTVLAFWSDGNAFVGGNLSGSPRQVFAFTEGTAGSPQLISSDSAGTTGNADSAQPYTTTSDTRLPAGAISSDGSKVAFFSNASNLTANAPNGGEFVKDRASGAITGYSISDVDFGVYPVVDATINSLGTVVGFSTSHAMISSDTNAASDVYTRSTSAPTAPPSTPPGVSNVNLTLSTYSTLPGFSELPASQIPATAIPLDSQDQVSGAPLRSVDLASSPLRSVPLRSVPLRSVPLRSVPLRSVTLSDLPLTGLNWETILGTLNPNPFAGVPLQSISLDAVLSAFDAQPAATGLNAVNLGNVDLSATPLRSVSLASVMLGATPLRSVPVPGPNALPFDNWCTLLTSLGYSCSSLGLTADSPVLSVDLAGVPLRSVPLRSVPLRSVPLRSVDLSTAPLRSVPLRSVFFGNIPLGTLPLTDIMATNPDKSLTSTPAPGALVDCSLVACATGTLADAFNANAFLANVTLGDLFDHVDPANLPGTLADLFQGLIDTANYPWWTLPLSGLQSVADQGASPTARKVTYDVTYDVTGTGTAPSTVSVTLPAGFRYVAGSTSRYDDTIAEPTVANEALTFNLTVTGGTTQTIAFDVYPGFDLVQNAPNTVAVTVGSTSSGALQLAPISVTEDFETSTPILTTAYIYDCVSPCYFGGSVPTPVIQPNTLVVSHIGSADDVDYFKVPVPPKGTRMQIELGNHSTNADFDVKMFNDGASTTSAPLRSVPLRSVPLRSVPLADQGVDATVGTEPVSPATLNDIPDGTAPLRSVSENRGTADELLVTTSDAAPTDSTGTQQYYTLQVTGYNGTFSNQPYVLYVKEYAPPPPPPCDARTFPFAGQGVAGSAPSSIASDRQTLFLVDQKRMGDTYGAAAASAAIAKINTLASRSDVMGVVYPVDGNAAVNTAMTDWDAHPCDVDKANAAYGAVGSIVDTVRQSAAGLKNIVIVGGDDQIPMARIPDYTTVSNEQDYAPSALLSNGHGTPVAAAEATQNILSDDPYGDTDPIPWLDHTLYVPDMAVGRLVETPADISALVDQYTAANGSLNPTTALTTGYDFLADGSQAVDTALGTRISSANRTSLINETWSKADELGALYPSGGSTPAIDSLNAHYDHTRSLPALGNSTGDESDLVTTADIAAHPNTLTNHIIFTMGCHAGLAMPKAYTDTAAKDADWAQNYLGTNQKAAVYFANTGFGYGDTASVALSEQLMKEFATRLDGTMTVGQAAAFAKQAYFAQLGAYGPYDEKAMQEATFYGLPFWKIGNATGATLPTPTANPTADSNGILSAPITLNTTFGSQNSAGGGTFYKPTSTSTNGLPVTGSGVQVTQYRPIEPKTAIDVTPASGGATAHGVLITSLNTTDAPTVPAVARPVIDLTATEQPPPAGDDSFPTTFQTLTSYNSPTGPRQQAVFMTGQFFDDASPTSAGGTQRLVTGVGGDVKYSTSNDFVAPQLSDIKATLDGTSLTFTVAAWDPYDGSTTFSTAPKRVVVLVKDGSGAWTPYDLTPDSSGLTWTATVPVSGTLFEYFVQALDGNGNVGISTNKGKYFTAQPAALQTAATPPKLTTDPGAPTGSNGWYTGNVNVTLQGTPGVTYTTSVDGGPATTYTGPVSITTDGTHVVTAAGSDNSNASLVVVVDKTAPTINGSLDRQPNANGWYKAPVTASFTCTDPSPGSGVRTCGPGTKFTLDGANQSITGKALDFAGNQSAPKTLGPVNLDQTKPTVAVTGVTDGANYTLGSPPQIGCTASDALSGLAGPCTISTTGGLQNGVGYYTTTATATDKAGNVNTAVVHFTALYRWDGFLQPINDTAHQIGTSLSVFSAGSTVPVKFQLKRADGTIVTANSAPLWITPVKGAKMSAPVDETLYTSTASTGSTYTWDAVNQQYVYNWKTTKQMAGYWWQIGVQLDDGSIYTVVIGLR